MSYTENTPNAAKLLSALRSTGYDNYSAICDLIDNALDANADMVKVDIGKGHNDEFVITIADNGDGMDEATLDQALRLGSDTQRTDESLGKYGMGLVTASISMGRRLIVITKKEHSFYTGIQDLDEVTKENSFVKTLRESNDVERNHFLQVLGGVESGTVLVIQKIDNIQNKNSSAFTSKLIRDCGEVFRYFLNANKKIVINKKDVKPVDPLMLDAEGTEIFIDEEHIFDVDGNKTSARLRIVHLPNYSQAESERLGLNIPHQGFYVLRNNRQIARAQSLGIIKRHGDLNRFRAELFINAGLDKKVGVNFKKEGIHLSDEVRSWIELLATPQTQAIRALAKKEQQKSKTPVDHESSQRLIVNKASLLKKPKPSPKKGEKPEVTSVRSDDYANVEFKVENNTRLAPLFQPELIGKSLVISYNADHPFYQRVFAEIRNNPDLTNAVDSMVYSMSLAVIHITSKEELWPLQDEFFDNMSDNLRALLT